MTDQNNTQNQPLTHFDNEGNARMVDVSDKADTKRTAVAEGFIAMQPATLEAILSLSAKKGDALADARIAGIMAAKKTGDLIPLCHPLMLTKVSIDLEPVTAAEDKAGRCGIHVIATTSLTGKTGVEMEALTAVSVTCLTIYDMCKAIDRGMEICEVRLVLKEGGKSGLWQREK